MSKKLGVLIIHGMGSQSPGFANEFLEKMEKRLKRIHANPDEICFKPMYWADVLLTKQKKLWADMKRRHDFDFSKIRKFIIKNLGDATAYRKDKNTVNTVYDKIHAKMYTSLQDLRRELGDKDKPLMIIAHSLGGLVMSNYIYDIQQGKGQSNNPFEKMETLTNIITCGCNIPLFTLAYDPIVPIDFPVQGLNNYFSNATQGQIDQVTKWNNYFDVDDILGYPLKTLQGYKNIDALRDFEINVGGLLTSWNPLSHTEYWQDSDFIKPIAQLIKKTLPLI